MSCGRLARPCDTRHAKERKPEADPYVPSARLMLRAMVRPLSVSVRTSSARWATAATWRPSTHHLSDGMLSDRPTHTCRRHTRPPVCPAASAASATSLSYRSDGMRECAAAHKHALHKPVVPVRLWCHSRRACCASVRERAHAPSKRSSDGYSGYSGIFRNARSLETQQRRVVIFSPTRVLEMYLDLHSVSFYAAPAQRSFATECGADAHTLVHVTRTLHAPTHGPSIHTRTRRTGIQ